MFRGSVLTALVVILCTTGCEERRKAGHLERGEEYFAAGQYQEALIEFLNVLQIEADNPQAIDRIGAALHETGQYGAAFSYLQRSVERDPSNIEARAHLARIYLLSGQREEAREEAQAVLDLGAQNLDALTALADTAVTEEEMNDAVDLLANAPQHENRAQYHLALGALHFRKQDAAAAELSFQEAARREPDVAEAHLALGTFYLVKNDLTNAEEEYKRAAEVAPKRSTIQLRIVDFYRRTGETAEANRRLDALVAEAPDFGPAWSRIAAFAAADGDLDRAEEALNRLLEVNPRSYEAHQGLGDVLRRRGNTSDAETRYREAITILQDYVSRRPDSASSHLRLAELHERVGNFAQAIAELQTMLQLEPNSPQNTLRLSDLLIRSGDASRAVAMLENLLERRPSARGFQLLGLGHTALSDHDEAAIAF